MQDFQCCMTLKPFGKNCVLNLALENFCGTPIEFLPPVVICYHKLTLTSSLNKHFNTEHLLVAPQMKSYRRFGEILIAIYHFAFCFH